MLRQSKRVFTLTVLTLLVASTFLPASAQLSQWRSLNPYRDGTLPIGGPGLTTAPPFLYSVHLLTANYGWAVGGDCDIYTLPLAPLAVGFAPACQALPGKGFTLFYDGAKWRNVLVPGTTGTLTAVFVVSTTDVWAVGLGPTIIHWDGIAWTLVPAPAGLADLFGLFMLPGGTDGWAVGDGAAVDNIRWSGTFPTGAWSAGPTPNLKAAPVLRAVSLSSPTFGWIVASDGGIFKWDGSGWLPQISPVTVDLLSVNAVSSTDAWAVGAGSTIIRWNGASWTGPMVAPTAGIDYRSIKMVSAADGWIAGALNTVTVEGLLLRWNGVAWNIVRSWVTQDLNGLFMLPGGTNGSAVGDAETIIYWTNVQWISQTSPTAFPLFDVHMVSTNDGWAVGGPFLLNDPPMSLPISGYGGSGWSVSSSLTTITDPSSASTAANVDRFGTITAGLSPTTVTAADTQTTTSSRAVIWTDKSDYSPGDTPTIYGSGFNANAQVTVSVIRPDGTVDTWSTISSDLGRFTTIYALDGIRGLYAVTATDGTNTATTTFTDGTKSVQCDNGPGPTKAPCTWKTGTLNAPTAYAEGDSVAYSVWIDSLAPSSTGNTVVIEYDFTKQTAGGLIVLGFDFLTDPDSSETATSTRCAGIPGGTNVPNCAAMTAGSTDPFESDPFTFSTSGVNLPLNGQKVADREDAYDLSHPSLTREPVIFGGDITDISVPLKIGDPNTAASRSQVTITFDVGSFNANSCASATSCAVNILFGAHIAQGTPAPAGWGVDRGASDFPGSSLATSIDGGSRSIAPAGIKSSPTIATVLSSASITVGGSVYDTATLSGATSDAGGTVTYYYYSGGTCSGTGTQVGSPVTVMNGIVPNSALQQFNSVGSFSWNAVYSGDAKNNGATSACEPLTVNKASPTIGTELSSSSISAGGSVTDSATLTGATSNAGGTVTYNVYSGGTCSGGTLDSDTKTVTGGVVPTSKSFTFPNAGTFSFQAVYTGDANNNGATSDCSTELLSVGPNPMTITTLLSQTIINIGGSVRDKATLSGSTLGTAGGTVTYSVFSGPACGGPALDTDTVTVASGNVVDSKWFIFNSAGTFSFLAVYSGDANHNGATSICNTEILTVNKASPSISTSVSSGGLITIGGSATDTAALTGGSSPTGSITFTAYSDPSCTILAFGPNTKPVSSASATSDPFTPGAIGIYYWKASYGGDSNNNGVTSVCGSSGPSSEVLTVQKVSLITMGSSIFHWDGTHWFHYETLPSPNTLLGVFMLNTNDGWAVGSAATPTSPPVILHWNGVAWVVKTPPGVALGGTLMDVHALTPTEAWAVGFGPAFGAASAPPIVKWDGTIWASVPSGLPTGAVLTDVHMLSSTDGWAVGCDAQGGLGCTGGVILHWNGLAWSSVTAPAGIAGLLDVFMLSPTNGWAVGNVAADGQGTIIHWDGAQWRRVSASTGAFLTSVHMVSATDGWTVGFDTVSDLSLIMHWNGLTWDVVSTPPVPPTMNNILTSVFMVSALDGWAVSGFTIAPNAPGFGAGSGLFLHYWSEIVCEATSTLTSTATISTTVTQTATSTSTTTTAPPGFETPGYSIALVVILLLAGLMAGLTVWAVLRRPRRRY